eukprot:6240521-Prymnesium_polylepis.1
MSPGGGVGSLRPSRAHDQCSTSPPPQATAPERLRLEDRFSTPSLQKSSDHHCGQRGHLERGGQRGHLRVRWPVRTPRNS